MTTTKTNTKEKEINGRCVGDYNDDDSRTVVRPVVRRTKVRIKKHRFHRSSPL